MGIGQGNDAGREEIWFGGMKGQQIPPEVAAWLPREQSEDSLCSVWDAALVTSPCAGRGRVWNGSGPRRRFGPDFQF